MYFWNIKALKKELVANTLTESQVFAYFLTMLTLNALVYESIPLFPSAEETTAWDYAGYVGSVVFTLGGTLLAYRVNGGSAGKDFLRRYFPLMWVLTVRFLVVLLPLFVVALIPMFYFFGTEAADEDSVTLSMYVVIMGWAWFLAFYYRLAVHMRDVARAA